MNPDPIREAWRRAIDGEDPPPRHGIKPEPSVVLKVATALVGVVIVGLGIFGLGAVSEKAREVLAVSHLAAIDGPPDWDWDWAENLFHENQDAAHDGDCTKKPYTCTRCVIDEAVWFADQTLAALADAGLAVVPVEPTEEMVAAGAAADWVGEYEGRAGRSIIALPEEERAEGLAEWREMYADDDTPDEHAPLAYRSPGIWAAMLAAAIKP